MARPSGALQCFKRSRRTTHSIARYLVLFAPEAAGAGTHEHSPANFYARYRPVLRESPCAPQCMQGRASLIGVCFVSAICNQRGDGLAQQRYARHHINKPSEGRFARRDRACTDSHPPRHHLHRAIPIDAPQGYRWVSNHLRNVP